MRRAGTSTPQRVAYQWLMRSRSAGRPTASVYCERPACSAASAAATTGAGAVKSGSPMFRYSMRSPPCAGSHAGERAISCATLAHSIT